jgi:hypothetical protein
MTTITIECPNDEKLLAAIGRIACASAHFEDALVMALKSLLGLTADQARIIFARTGPAVLKSRSRKLLSQRNRL